MTVHELIMKLLMYPMETEVSIKSHFDDAQPNYIYCYQYCRSSNELELLVKHTD